MSIKTIVAAASAAVLLSGCASLFSGSNQGIDIVSTPEGANVTVVNEAGEVVFTGVTPTEATLKRGAGFFEAQKYSITVEKEGLAPETVVLESGVNGWTYANLLLGGVIGILIDGASGSIYTYKPKSVDVTLGEQAAVVATSINELSAEERATLQPIS